jgi:P-type Ca2+ transporter type 2C
MEPESAWHSRPLESVFAAVHSDAGGLTSVEARARLVRDGRNLLPPDRPISGWRILASQFASVVVLLLAVAAAVSLAFGDHFQAAAIGIALALNAGIGFVMELRARRAIESLLALDLGHASVLRDGKLTIVDAADLACGDLIELDAGSRVPADARLVETVDLTIDESALTGE